MGCCCKVFNAKLLLGFFNLVFMLCSVAVLFAGFHLFTDNKRLLLTSLIIIDDHPLHAFDLSYPIIYYVAFILTVFGMVIAFISFIGFCTSCMSSYPLLVFYFLLIVMLLIIQFLGGVVVITKPQFLGLNVNTTQMVRILQGTYGVPNHEQWTIAMDYAQTFLDCCAINDSINYDTSLWRLQKLGRDDLSVPLTCCKLMNKFEENSYLDPVPVNMTLCQSIQPQDFQKARHLEGCLDRIENWYREHYIILLYAGLLLSTIEFFILLSIILVCSIIKQKKLRHQISPSPVNFLNEMQSNILRRNMNENIYHEDFITMAPATSSASTIREVYIQPMDVPRDNYKRNHYRLNGKGLLV
ncbi:hypothetical protein ACKWTF_014616 [Chironomus riparius]